MANVLIFDEATGKPIEYRKSVHTPDYDGRSDVLINPVFPDNVPQKYLVVDSSKVREMTQAEKDSVDATEAQAILDAKIASVEALEGKLEDVLIALVKVINKRIPSNPITRKEFVQQYKEDQGLA